MKSILMKGPVYSAWWTPLLLLSSHYILLTIFYLHAFCITDPLWGESLRRSSNIGVWCLLCCWNMLIERRNWRWFETPWRPCDVMVIKRLEWVSFKIGTRRQIFENGRKDACFTCARPLCNALHVKHASCDHFQIFVDGSQFLTKLISTGCCKLPQ